MNSFLLFTVALIATLSSAYGRCAHDEYMEHTYRNDPSLRSRMDEQERQIYSAANLESIERQSATVYTIPTVVHIIYNTPQQNIDDGHVIDQIARLNIDYRNVKPSANTVSSFKSLETDIGIQFVLATTDPNGAATTGITRTATTITGFPNPTALNFRNQCKFAATGGHDIWDSTKYMNVWVCYLLGDTLGFAQQPGGNASTDGIVITSTAFGRLDASNTSPYNLGKTLTHEVGHWFNLLHPWGMFEDDCTEDDLVLDTPQSYAANYGCVLTTNNCGNLNMVQNYMDYADDNCMTLFTPGQKSRTQAEFTTLGRRSSVAMTNYQGDVVGLNNYVSPYDPASSATSLAISTLLFAFIALFL